LFTEGRTLPWEDVRPHIIVSSIFTHRLMNIILAG
jgi:hypothetical protein